MGLLTKINDFVLNNRILTSIIAGTGINYYYYKMFVDFNSRSFERMSDSLQYVAWPSLVLGFFIVKNYLAGYAGLDAINYAFNSKNRDRLYSFFSRGRRGHFKKALEINREPVYYLKLAHLDYKEGDEKSCIENLNNFFETPKPVRESDKRSFFAWFLSKLNKFTYGSESVEKEFMDIFGEITDKEERSDLENIILAAGLATHHHEGQAKRIIDEVTDDRESTVLLKSQVYSKCFIKYKSLAGKELEKIVDTSKLIPFSDRPRNSLFIVEVKDESLKGRILAKKNKKKGNIEKEYDLTALAYGVLLDLIPRPFGLVEKDNEKYLLMRNVLGQSYQKYFAKNGVTMPELEKLVDSISKYQVLAYYLSSRTWQNYIQKYDLTFDFNKWFKEMVTDRLGKEPDTKFLEATNDVNEVVKLYMENPTGMHGDFTIDNLLRRNTGQVTILDSERFKLGLGAFDMFNIFEDTRLNLPIEHQDHLFKRYCGDRDEENSRRKYNAIFYPKQLATAVMFHDYYRLTGNNSFELKAKHHINRMKINLSPNFQEALVFREAALEYLAESPLKKLV